MRALVLATSGFDFVSDNGNGSRVQGDFLVVADVERVDDGKKDVGHPTKKVPCSPDVRLLMSESVPCLAECDIGIRGRIEKPTPYVKSVAVLKKVTLDPRSE